MDLHASGGNYNNCLPTGSPYQIQKVERPYLVVVLLVFYWLEFLSSLLVHNSKIHHFHMK